MEEGRKRVEWEEWLGEWKYGRMPPGHRHGRVKGQCGITDHVQGEHNGSSGLSEALSSKALLSIQEVQIEAGFQTLIPWSRNPERLGDACGLFSCLWMALPTQKVCLCAHASGPLNRQPPSTPLSCLWDSNAWTG